MGGGRQIVEGRRGCKRGVVGVDTEECMVSGGLRAKHEGVQTSVGASWTQLLTLGGRGGRGRVGVCARGGGSMHHPSSAGHEHSFDRAPPPTPNPSPTTTSRPRAYCEEK